MKNDYLENRR